MDSDQVQSDALRRETLNSESYRIIAVLFVLGALLLLTAARLIVSREIGIHVAELLILLFGICYEAFILRAVKRSLRGEDDMPAAVLMANLFVETQIPTLGLFIIIQSNFMSANRALVAPAIVLYFVFIMISTLRLSPGLCLWAGFLSAVGYIAIGTYAARTNPGLDWTFGSFAFPYYFVYGLLIFGSGCVAAFVAARMRSHVLAALRGARLQSELDQVKHDLDIARSIQEGLLPEEPPGLDNFEIAGWNQPADQTGGDYFDWQELPDGRVAISLADATGHGIGPALVSASCRAYARASLLADGERDTVLDRLNRLLSNDLPSNRFVTFAAIFLTPTNSHVQIMSAGHGPILWYRYSDDTIKSIDAQGIPLGMISTIKYERAIEGTLNPGDFVALVTDGFFEWENWDGEDFGINRLTATLRDSRDLPSDRIIEKLRTAVSDFCGGTEQKDDLTVVILRRKRRS